VCPTAIGARFAPRRRAARRYRAPRYVVFECEAAHLAWTTACRCHRFPFVVRPVRRFPALSLFPGHMPAQLANCPAVGNGSTVGPTSASSTSAVCRLIPGMVVNRAIHCDVTPANILIRATDKQVLLGDLMLAKALEGALAKQVTRPGEVAGHVNYMSPERTRGVSDEVDARSDIFSLGATVYALLAGKSPFAGSSLVETITEVRTAEPIKPSTFQMSIPSAFEGWC
jgi:hypothetical protein